MSAVKTAPYGSWESPISSELVAFRTLGSLEPFFTTGEITLDGEDIYWMLLRPAEGGRYVVIRYTPDGQTSNMTPSGFDVRTTVHEVGGGGFAVSDGILYFSNFSDQRVYRLDASREPRPITAPGQLRYADYVVDRGRQRMICVREDHTAEGREAVNALVSLDLEDNLGGKVLVSGDDFYSSPRLSPDGSRLAWLAWNHPNMPWHGTELWLGNVGVDGTIGERRRVAGGPKESIFQPEWSPDGVLHFVSDRSGWWNIYRDCEGQVEPLCEMEAEFGMHQWAFGMALYAFESAQRIICAYNRRGLWHLASIDADTGKLALIDTPYTDIWSVKAAPGQAFFMAGSPSEPASVVRLDLAKQELSVLHRSSDLVIDPGYLSLPQPVEFPTERGLTAHAFFYAPRNRDYAAPADERPPLLVIPHGGPVGATWTTRRLEIQYWTSRGIAVLDVNYGGSTGYGRAYWERVVGQWGIVDVDDCTNGARYLVEQGKVDPDRLAISGGSAGGYTVLCALTFGDFFACGASYYGISDVERLSIDAHKFESHDQDHLIGPYPQERELYWERSPIHFVDRLSRPVIFFQGLDDLVVPPNQTEMMVDALRANGLPVAYVAFEGEQHGFRRAESIKRALDAELFFYSTIFGFELAEPVEPVEIQNL